METLFQNQGYLYSFSSNSFKKFADKKNNNENKLKARSGLIRVLIADDHPYLIHGVENDLNKDTEIKIIGNATNYDELIGKAAELQPDVVLLDLRMPGKDKHDLKHYITGLKAVGNCKVIVFSNETGWARMHRCLEIGAQAYIEKAIALGKLSELIHQVYENDDLYIYTAEELPQVKFSDRQLEVLHSIADGKENHEIAFELKLELKTVQSYVTEIKTKFSQAFSIHPLKPRTFLLLTHKLGFGHKVN